MGQREKDGKDRDKKKDRGTARGGKKGNRTEMEKEAAGTEEERQKEGVGGQKKKNKAREPDGDEKDPGMGSMTERD